MTPAQQQLLAQAKSELDAFAPITLEEMSAVKLMNRIDKKYAIPLAKLIPLLHVAAPQYYVQRIGGKSTASYHTVYLDTEDRRMYNIHQSGRAVRQKVRVRTYEETDTTFLEVKNKNNHGRTKKKRIVVPDVQTAFESAEAAAFVDAQSWFTLGELTPHVENFFDRITLVNRAMTERLTIDLGLRFHNLRTLADADLGHLVVVELKRDGLTHSPMQDIFLDLRIHPGGFSKYCIGCALTDPTLRHNNFKEKLRRVERMRSL